MTAAEWPPSIHPAARDNSWNVAYDLLADCFRERREGEHVMAVLVVVRDGQGRSTTIVRDEDGVRRVSSDEALGGREGAA